MCRGRWLAGLGGAPVREDGPAPGERTVADEPWYRAVVTAVASWTGASAFQVTGLLSSGVLAAAIVVFYAWRHLGSSPVRGEGRRLVGMSPPPAAGT
jgi:hypothetical protein